MSVHLIATGKHLHSLSYTHGCLLKTLALWIFSQQGEDLTIVLGQLL